MMKSIMSWILCLTPLWVLVAGIIMLEHQVLYRTEATINGRTISINICRNRELAVGGESFGLGFNLYEKNGHIMAKYGIWGGKGHLPIVYSRLATAEQIALYHKFFS